MSRSTTRDFRKHQASMTSDAKTQTKNPYRTAQAATKQGASQHRINFQADKRRIAREKIEAILHLRTSVAMLRHDLVHDLENVEAFLKKHPYLE